MLNFSPERVKLLRRTERRIVKLVVGYCNFINDTYQKDS